MPTTLNREGVQVHVAVVTAGNAQPVVTQTTGGFIPAVPRLPVLRDVDLTAAQAAELDRRLAGATTLNPDFTPVALQAGDRSRLHR